MFFLSRMTYQYANDAFYSFKQLHIADRIFQRPLSNTFEIPTHVPRVQLWPWQRVTFNHVEGEKPNVGVALCVEPQNLKTVVCMLPQCLGSSSKFSTKRLIVFLVRYSAEQIDAMQLVEDLHTDAIAFFICSGMVDQQAGGLIKLRKGGF